MSAPNIRRAVKVILEGRGPNTLKPEHHIQTGGEGSVYRLGKIVVKIYTDKAKMRKDGMVDKISLLSKIRHPFIIAPKGLVTTSSGDPIGYYMDFVKGESLARVFTSDFRARQNIGDKDAIKLVDGMRTAVEFAHSMQAILVDANETNYLALLSRKDGPEPRLIDVDSWAIGRWPAKVIMPSVRDWHTKGFNELSDWFSWGIVTFQVFTGIHPYKGTLDGYGRSDLEKRMKDNASVFSSGVRLNRAVRDFSCISGSLLNWYQATFQHGERSVPPSPFATGIAVPGVIQVARIVTTGATGMLVYDKLYQDAADPALWLFPCGVVILKSGVLIDLASKRKIGKATSRECEIIKTDNGWLKADWNNGQIYFSHLNGINYTETRLNLVVNCTGFLRFENRLFVITDSGLTEVTITVFGQTTILSVGNTWGAMINETRWFDGVGVQNAMGATFLIAPFGEKACSHVRVRELDELQPVAGRAGNRFVVITGIDKKGDYHRVEFAMSKDYTSYKVNKEAVDGPELNIAILPKGVCTAIHTDGELEIVVPSTGQVKIVPDNKIRSDMRLGNWRDRVTYVHNGAIWAVRLQ